MIEQKSRNEIVLGILELFQSACKTKKELSSVGTHW